MTGGTLIVRIALACLALTSLTACPPVSTMTAVIKLSPADDANYRAVTEELAVRLGFRPALDRWHQMQKDEISVVFRHEYLGNFGLFVLKDLEKPRLELSFSVHRMPDSRVPEKAVLVARAAAACLRERFGTDSVVIKTHAWPEGRELVRAAAASCPKASSAAGLT